jgi:MSHA pilin protein MshB
MKRKNSQKGFTIIELVVVILLLGILTATALPRFMDVTDEAHTAVVTGVLAGLQTSSGLLHAQWYGEGQPSTVSEYAGMVVNTAGWAVGDSTVHIKLGTDCETIFETLLQEGGRPTLQVIATTGLLATGDLKTASAVFKAKADPTDNACRFGYVGQFQDGAASTQPVIRYTAADGLFVLGTSE